MRFDRKPAVHVMCLLSITLSRSSGADALIRLYESVIANAYCKAHLIGKPLCKFSLISIGGFCSVIFKIIFVYSLKYGW